MTTMRKTLLLFAVGILAASQCCLAQVPDGFHWINLESDKVTMAVVRRALQGQSFTAIREVGVKDNFALVITANRDADASVPSEDQLTIYSIALSTAKMQPIVNGYDIRLWEWMGKNSEDLTISYYDCSDCEPAGLFTALHLKPNVGWVARWQSKKDGLNPGGVIFVGDAGEPYTDDDVTEVFAVIKAADNSYAAGSWTHSYNTTTRKTEDSVLRYRVDMVTGKDIAETLTGARTEAWKRRICKEPLTLSRPNQGQDSQICKTLLKESARTSIHK
jgi:hypothetical protein